MDVRRRSDHIGLRMRIHMGMDEFIGKCLVDVRSKCGTCASSGNLALLLRCSSERYSSGKWLALFLRESERCSSGKWLALLLRESERCSSGKWERCSSGKWALALRLEDAEEEGRESSK